MSTSGEQSVFSDIAVPQVDNTVVENIAGEDSLAGNEDGYTRPPNAETLRHITQRTRFAVLEAIIGHETAPSMAEIANYTPVKSSAARSAVADLEEEGVLDCYRVHGPERKRHNPFCFWVLSDEGRELLEEYGILDEESREFFEQRYQNAEQSRTVRGAANAPRPVDILEE